MSRIIMDTSSLATIMASAKPTGSQANNQAAITLLATLTKIYGESVRYTEIKKALDSFYAKRGLNLPCRILDSFFSDGARNKARSYLTSLEVIALLGQVNDRNVETLKPLVHRYMQEKGLLEPADETLNVELVKDHLHNHPPQQSPYLTAHILSRLCHLSDKPTDMINTWDISEFTIFGDKTGTAHDVVHLPVQGAVTFNDDDLPFAGYKFQFLSSSLENNSFCKEFLASEKIGDASRSGTETLTQINITKRSLSTLLEKIVLYYTQLGEQANELKKSENEIADLLIHDNGKNNVDEKLNNLKISTNHAFDRSRLLKGMYATYSENAKLFASYNVQLLNDLINRCAIIPLGERGVVKLAYEDMEETPELYEPRYWNDRNVLYTWLEKSENGFLNYMNAIGNLQNELIHRGEVYREELHNYSKMVESYYIDSKSISLKEIALANASKVIRTSQMDVKAVSDYITIYVDIYKNIISMDTRRVMIKKMQAHVFKLRQEFIKARFDVLSTQVPIPEDNYLQLENSMTACVNNINAAMQRLLNRGIVSIEFLNDCAEITDSHQLSKKIEDAAHEYKAILAEREFGLR